MLSDLASLALYAKRHCYVEHHVISGHDEQDLRPLLVR